MENEINFKDLEGRYFFWKDDWNWVYEGIYVKKSLSDDQLSVERFYADENCLDYDKESFIFREQDGYFEDIEKYEVDKEEFWANVEHYTIEYYEIQKNWEDVATSKENN